MSAVIPSRRGSRRWAILALILEGRLGWVGRLGDGNRYEHLMVDIDDVVAVMRAGASKEGLFADEVRGDARWLFKSRVGRAVAAGLLSTRDQFCPRSKRTMSVLTRESVEAFVDRYVSVGEIRARTGVDIRLIARRLADAGVGEAIDRRILGKRIYGRREAAASGVFPGWGSAGK